MFTRYWAYEGGYKEDSKGSLVLYKEAKAVEMALQAELEQYRWIPVSERLPDKSGEYWVCDFSDTTLPRFCVSWFALNGTGFNYSSATHWKPITLP